MDKNILILSSEFPPGPGGIGQHAFSLACGLRQFRNHVTVMTISDYSSKGEIELFDKKNDTINIVRFKRYFPIVTQFFRFVKILRFICLSSSEIDVLFLSGRFPLIFVSIFGNFFKIKDINKIGILHGSEINPSRFIEKYLNLKGIINCNKLICVSEFTENLIPEYIRLKFNKNNLLVIGNGLTRNSTISWDNTSGNYQLKGSPKLLTVGNVIPRKGHHLVVEALPDILIEFPDVHYHIVGIRRDTVKLDSVIKRNGTEKICSFHGRVKKHAELALFYRSVDILMLLSENQVDGDVEGFGIVALEANYFGIPVIGAKGTGVESAIKNGYSGLLVDATNKIQIIEAIREILNNRDFYSRESKLWSFNNHWDNISLKFEKCINCN